MMSAMYLMASQSRGFQRNQILACVILKLMHVIHHMEAAELRYSLPISEESLLEHAERSIKLWGRKNEAVWLSTRVFLWFSQGEKQFNHQA